MNLRHISGFYRLLALAGMLLLSLFLAATPAMAADLRANDTVVVGANEVVNDDLYAFASRVTIDGRVKGDVVAMGSEVIINGTVEGDVFAAAQTVIVNGTVAESLRAGGAIVMLGPTGRVMKDLTVGATAVETKAGSSVGRDLLVGGYQTLLAGEIGRNVTGGMVGLELRGPVGGDVNVTVSGETEAVSPLRFMPAGPVVAEEIAPKLVVADSARINGKLIYATTIEPSIGQAATIGGGIERTMLPSATPPPNPIVASPFWGYLRHFVALLAVGLLLMWLAPAWSRRLADDVQARPLPALGWGFVVLAGFIGVAFILIPLIVILLAILFGMLTLGRLMALVISVGLVADAALIVAYAIFVSYIAQAIIGYLAGRWLLQQLHPAWAERPFAPLTLGLLLYVALTAIPWVGFVVTLLVGLFALGAALDWVRTLLGRTPPTPAPLGRWQPV